ncbi:MAG: bifunctional diaminohydroxyphosphoribosylaminopyrimidine deaminase/5-amino-6-(5-phosphoribosylamino)uracil reductase RibD [bacterium]|nr:bifunctional diaminohydroxyphosphoribosylaminopyrimidine deaminase/5-amino-6-(5-phosphoribosylamino)uracil reductase RibD [bacterium]
MGTTTGEGRRLLRRALKKAAEARPHPNPRVGALVMDPGGQLVGTGVHQGPGSPHAETLALDEAGSRAKGGTLITTLEPCVHSGRTPPCVDRITGAGVAAVVVGADDPDRRVSGRGRAVLEELGIEVAGPLLTEEVEAADPAYFHHRRTGRPRFTLKAAVTLDGWTAARDGTSQWISGPAARRDGHRLRASADGVMVGAGTLRADDPSLTVRLEGARTPQPPAVVVAGRARLPAVRKLWERRPLVIAPQPTDVVPPDLQVIAPGGDGLVDLALAARALGERGLLEVLVEGGPRLAGGMWSAGLIDRGVFYMAARVAGGEGLPVMSGAFSTLSASRQAIIEDVQKVGEDLRIEWRPRRESA